MNPVDIAIRLPKGETHRLVAAAKNAIQPAVFLGCDPAAASITENRELLERSLAGRRIEIGHTILTRFTALPRSQGRRRAYPHAPPPGPPISLRGRCHCRRYFTAAKHLQAADLEIRAHEREAALHQELPDLPPTHL